MDESTVLIVTAWSVAIVHTLLGPDHYLPFVVLARAEGWSTGRTLRVALVCGLGHVLGSIVLGLVGIAVGAGLFRFEQIEAVRGDIASWLLIGGGLVYLVWGVRHAIRGRPHTHVHVHADGTVHSHEHNHHSEHAHVHKGKAGGSRTPLVLFTIFILGPCEPLIPLLMYSAAKGWAGETALVALVFVIGTLGTMMAAIALGLRVASVAKIDRYERYSHAIAGLIVLACGVAVKAGF